MIRLSFLLSVFLLFAAEILRIYFVMPFAGSQELNALGLAYFLHRNIIFIRLFVFVVIAIAAFICYRRWTKKGIIFLTLATILYGIVFYFANYELVPGELFYDLQNKRFSFSPSNKIDRDNSIIGVTVNGESKAYPIQIIAYHHQVEDTIGGEAVVVTYCTACHTGRVYALFANGKKNTYHVVGMDHYNAILEDVATASWWRQATGVAIAGPLKGESLREIPSSQMTLSAWLRNNPNSLVLQPDTLFRLAYEEFAGSERTGVKGILEQRNGSAWQSKSWVVGIVENEQAKAYDWNEMLMKQVINDSLAEIPVLLVLEPDRKSYHVWKRNIGNRSLQFVLRNNILLDTTTNSSWNFDGICIEGPLSGHRLESIHASQEFWHSWQTFHPGTLKFTSFRG